LLLVLDLGFAVVNYLALPGKNISGDVMMGVFVSGKHIRYVG
jgi:hypothetical protein